MLRITILLSLIAVFCSDYSFAGSSNADNHIDKFAEELECFYKKNKEIQYNILNDPDGSIAPEIGCDKLNIGTQKCGISIAKYLFGWKSIKKELKNKLIENPIPVCFAEGKSDIAACPVTEKMIKVNFSILKFQENKKMYALKSRYSEKNEKIEKPIGEQRLLNIKKCFPIIKDGESEPTGMTSQLGKVYFEVKTNPRYFNE